MAERVYIFDCDQTLYPVGHRFYKEVTDWLSVRFCKLTNRSLEEFIEELRHLRAEGHEPGIEAALRAGLTQVELAGDYHLHQPYHLLEACAETRQLIAGLPGRKVILTHGFRPYTDRILEQLQLADLFEHVYDMVHVGDAGKSRMDFVTFAQEDLGVAPEDCVYVEDTVACLVPAHKAGMRTVLVHPTMADHPHVSQIVPDLVPWLRGEQGVAS